MLTFLKDTRLRLLFFGGKGGVGKTTCAAAAALHLARTRPTDTFLLVSTDPAHSLADSLADFQPPANLTVLEFSAQECLEAFKAKHRDKLREIAARGTFLDDEDISRFLDLSLPGLDELMALLEISRWAEAGDYATIIVDTAPTGHTLRLLMMPELIRHWLKALDALLAKHRFMKARFSRTYKPDELDRFLLDWSASVQGMEKLLRDRERCRFVPVMLAEEVVLRETLALLRQLREMHMPVREILVNRLFPDSACPVCAEGRRRQRRICRYFSYAEDLAGYSFWEVPLYPEEVRGEVLAAFWDGVRELEAPGPALTARPGEQPPLVEGAPGLPAPDLTMIIFAGKGGVGKTTLACATALRLAQDFPGQGIFLFSTDPAHSLADCLEVSVGPKPVRLAPGLTAMEIDAPGEFAALKRQYQQELERLLGSMLEHLDLPFDRPVLEGMLDLAPPGLDEIMALTRAMDLLDQGRYDLFILDSAPTGHLLRLLEMPEIIDQWLKTFFGFLLKYKMSFSFPDLSQRLVRLSKGLKRLRDLWRDPRRSSLYAVAILTEMAFQETRDLLAACDHMGLKAPVLFLNQVTPPAADCHLCAALNRRESAMRARFRQAFPDQHLTLIYRGGDPLGVNRLRELGQTLYRPPAREKQKHAVLGLPAMFI
jgi:arsenite-transporting ATPase